MLNRIKNSLLSQTSFLFLLSLIFIVILWIFFYIQQKDQEDERNIGRYFSSFRSLQPFLMQSIPIADESLEILDMKIFKGKIPKKHKIIFKKSSKFKGFTVIEFENKKVIHIYNSISEIVLEDIAKTKSMIVVHIVFLLLLISQSFYILGLENL